MKIVTIVGARPQFIKAAVVSHELRKNHQEILVHTGQHYDYNMSEQFFQELEIPTPEYNLGISGGTHAQMTGNMMMAIESVLAKEKPDWLLLYGDTNSTLAASLAGAKLYIPICHVEAGAREHGGPCPEKINRVVTDHLSTLLLASSESHLKELENEGLTGQFVGNVMYDTFLEYSNKLRITDLFLPCLDGTKICIPERYYYMTCHREENTGDDHCLREILTAMNSLDAPTVYPVHPRNRKAALRLKEREGFRNIITIEPVGYLESACLVRNAEKIVTDSGGLQTEAFFAGKKCVTILDCVVWPETMADGRNELSNPDAKEILEKLSHPQVVRKDYQPFGDGHAARKVVRALETYGRTTEI